MKVTSKDADSAIVQSSADFFAVSQKAMLVVAHMHVTKSNALAKCILLNQMMATM